MPTALPALTLPEVVPTPEVVPGFLLYMHNPVRLFANTSVLRGRRRMEARWG